MYQDIGRSIKHKTLNKYFSKLFENIGLCISTISKLDFIEILPVENENVENVPDEKHVNTETDLISFDDLTRKIQSNFEDIQKNGPTSIKGSLAFTRMCQHLLKVDSRSHLLLMEKFKSKKVFKYLVEASAASVEDLETFENTVQFLSEKKESLLGTSDKYYFNLLIIRLDIQ